MSRSFLFGSLALVSALASAGPVSARPAAKSVGFAPASFQLAQNYDEPPASIPNAGGGYGQPQGSGSAQEGEPQGQDPASLLVRIDRLEDQVRTLNGQIQQLQFSQKQLVNDLKKFQGDVDFRFRERDGHAGIGKRADVDAPSAPPSDSAAGPARHDAFDPAADPDAPGAPRQLGSLRGGAGPRVISAPSAALGGSSPRPAANPDAPLDLGGSSAASTPPSSQVGFAATPAAGLDSGPISGGDSAGSSNPREDFDLALVSFNNGQFAAAARGFRGFLQRHPSSGLVPEATFYLGESYWRRGLTRQAAEQYLKISTRYAKSSRAPESLLKLGLSLEKLGSREQACASWEQIGRKYPNAPAAIRVSAGQNIKRNQC
ncbi:MAG TPA: tol-pal system protein YbgF [Beijerinckiaceae bacterium]|nr:tol-pal system protein YbgF [Beijerinckiaceae bacterium]